MVILKINNIKRFSIRYERSVLFEKYIVRKAISQFKKDSCIIANSAIPLIVSGCYIWKSVSDCWFRTATLHFHNFICNWFSISIICILHKYSQSYHHFPHNWLLCAFDFWFFQCNWLHEVVIDVCVHNGFNCGMTWVDSWKQKSPSKYIFKLKDFEHWTDSTSNKIMRSWR